jgi:hypothetical protein
MTEKRHPKSHKHPKHEDSNARYANREDALRRCMLRCKSRHVEHGHVKKGHNKVYQRCIELCEKATDRLSH